MRRVRRQDFAYSLPPKLIAQSPLAERSASRLLVLDGVSGECRDRSVRELPQLLRPHDLLVLNDTRVVPTRLIGHKPSGGRVEILLERPLEDPQALAQLSASKPIRAGLAVHTSGGVVQVLERESDHWRIRLPAPALEFFERFGAVPLPPYIHRTALSEDRERYQEHLRARARRGRSAHREPAFRCRARAGARRPRIGRAFVTLHVGAGTFQPVRV